MSDELRCQACGEIHAGPSRFGCPRCIRRYRKKFRKNWEKYGLAVIMTAIEEEIAANFKDAEEYIKDAKGNFEIVCYQRILTEQGPLITGIREYLNLKQTEE